MTAHIFVPYSTLDSLGKPSHNYNTEFKPANWPIIFDRIFDTMIVSIWQRAVSKWRDVPDRYKRTSAWIGPKLYCLEWRYVCKADVPAIRHMRHMGQKMQIRCKYPKESLRSYGYFFSTNLLWKCLCSHLQLPVGFNYDHNLHLMLWDWWYDQIGSQNTSRWRKWSVKVTYVGWLSKWYR